MAHKNLSSLLILCVFLLLVVVSNNANASEDNELSLAISGDYACLSFKGNKNKPSLITNEIKDKCDKTLPVASFNTGYDYNSMTTTICCTKR